MSVENVIDNLKCTGCMVCRYICPNKCIDTYYNEEGFLYPIISQKKCTECGACEKKCPVLEESEGILDAEYVYAVCAEDTIRDDSSSGGAFTLLAECFLRKGGVVCGAVIDENNRVKHIVCEEERTLAKMRGSKYVQSDMSHIFEDIRKYLHNGRRVLFSGTACQCDAVKKCFDAYSDLLFTVDVLCMGVPSPKLFDRYLKEELGGHVRNINFRDKKANGWCYDLTLAYQNDEGKTVYLNNKDSSFYTAFLKGYCLRKSCYECKYSGKKRPSDITIGDFWRCEEYDDKLNDSKGTSLILVSSDRGRALIEEIKKRCKVIESVPVANALKGNSVLIKPVDDKGKRREFFNSIQSDSLSGVVDRLSHNKADFGIINYWYTNDNGAILTAYALQQTLHKHGYSSRLIDFSQSDADNDIGISKKFARKYLFVSDPVHGEKDLRKLVDSINGFIVGSDQVFRAEWVPDSWFLDFVPDCKNKIAVSASFGKDRLDISGIRLLKIRYLLSRFNALSIREKAGTDLCRRLSGRKVETIIDPVFWLSKDEYLSKLSIRTEVYEKRCVFVYIRDMDEKKKSLCDAIGEYYKCEVFFASDETEVEIFIGKLACCCMVITDSYHGTCFSLIFNKKFICIWNEKRGGDRFSSLIDLFGLNKEVFLKDEMLDKKHIDLEREEDWARINLEIKKKASNAEKWLLEVISEVQRIPMWNYSQKRTRYKFVRKCRSDLDTIKRIKSYAKMCLFEKDLKDKLVLFGAGDYGNRAVNTYNGRIAFFIDNDKNKKWLAGYPVYRLKEAEKALRKDRDVHIVVTTSHAYRESIVRQLSDAGFKNISVYDPE